MTNESIYSRYEPAITPPSQKNDSDFWFIFHNNKLLVKVSGEAISIPRSIDFKSDNLKIVRSQYLGKLEGYDCYSAESLDDRESIDDLSFRDLRSLLEILEDDIFLLAGRASQMVLWDQTNQYCGRCGSLANTKPDERVKVCPKCGLLSYPRISPAIIVTVIKDGCILLAHNNNFRPNLYSLIAGFVESGETFEECVSREVKEEVGISVKNIKYFGSQPWPFPNSLMVAFTAEYEDGEIKVDGIEIGDARWFNVDNLPTIPSKGSISRCMIDWYIEKYTPVFAETTNA